jgi:hypothetical protein
MSKVNNVHAWVLGATSRVRDNFFALKTRSLQEDALYFDSHTNILIDKLHIESASRGALDQSAISRD